jgi:HEPN domain-containing protein
MREDDPKSWRSFADMDMEAARVLASDERPGILAHVICFHAHQAAEKYLKGLIVAGDEEPPRIHALPELLSRATVHVPDLDTEQVHTAANGLNAYYIPSRYPVEAGGSSGPITATEASEALVWAEAIAAEIRPRLEAANPT